MKQKLINYGVLLLFVLSPSFLPAQFATTDWYAFEFVENRVPKVNLNGKIYEPYKRALWDTEWYDFSTEGIAKNGRLYFTYMSKLVNVRYLFMYDRKYIMKDGEITELPQGEYGIFRRFYILENGNFGLLLEIKDTDLEILMVNGKVIKKGGISNAFITELSKILYIHHQDGMQYINIDGTDYQTKN